MKKKMLLTLGVMLLAASAGAATLRVNNVAGSGAPYSSYAAAEADAVDGDVIIVDPSETSYGEIVITKKITLKGPGYFFKENNVSQEGGSTARFDMISVRAAGAKVTGVTVESKLQMMANDLVVTRNCIWEISVCVPNSFTDEYISRGVIHQNYIYLGISGDSYSAPASFMQVTNNIVARGYNAILCNLTNSYIARNTFINRESAVRQVTNSVLENNIGTLLEDSYWANKDNTYNNNYPIALYDANVIYGVPEGRTDLHVKEVDATLTTDCGAFSGDDPYVLSGLPTGPMIQDIEMPESVVKGEDLKVTVKIGVSR